MMQSVSVRELKTNPSVALRHAAQDLVVVTNRDEPEALLLNLNLLGLADLQTVKKALAQTLFKQGTISLGYSARMAGLTKTEWLQHLNRQGIPIINHSATELQDDLLTARQFLKAQVA